MRCLLCQPGPCLFSQHGINVAFSYGDSLKKLKYHLSICPQQEFTDACRQEGDSEQGSFAFNAF